MTLKAVSAETAFFDGVRHPVKPSTTQAHVIGTMFGFLSKDLAQRAVIGLYIPVAQRLDVVRVWRLQSSTIISC